MLSRNKVGVSEAVAGDVALVAQLVEHLFYTQRVMGSSPIQSKFIIYLHPSSSGRTSPFHGEDLGSIPSGCVQNSSFSGKMILFKNYLGSIPSEFYLIISLFIK